MEVYDVIIIGSGPAGLTAGLYTVRAGLKTIIVEKEAFGGYLVNIDLIENYPGFSEGVPGNELAHSMVKQAAHFGVEFMFAEVIGLEIEDGYRVVRTLQGDCFGKAVIIAGGSHPKKLAVPGEEEFLGKGVSYCVICDGSHYNNKVVAMAGGGDAGITGALYMSKISAKVIVIEVMPEFAATQVLMKRASENPKIELRCGTKIKSIVGDDQVRRLNLLDIKTEQESTLEVDGVFIYVGLEPNTSYIKGMLTLDSEGQILVNDQLGTNITGYFAAGDVRHNSKRQVITATGDGATAALSAIEFLRSYGS